MRVGAHGRTADTKTSLTPYDASAQELGGKGTRFCTTGFELEHAQGSCNDRRGIILDKSWRYLVSATPMGEWCLSLLKAVKVGSIFLHR